MAADRVHAPLIILGLDGADPDLLLRWARAGHLPTLASVLEHGCWARTCGPELISEHGVWVSLMTGLSTEEHGYYYLRQLVPGSYDLRTVTGRDLDVQPFWASLAGKGSRVAVLDVPDAPLVPGVAGWQLLDWAPHYTPNEAIGEPASVLQTARSVYGPRMTNDERVRATAEEDLRTCARLLDRVARKERLCLELMRDDPPDLAVLAFGEAHTAGHQFWRYSAELTSGEVTPGQGGLDQATRVVYQGVDGALGRILEALPSRANVVLLGSVGMKDQYPTAGLIESFCRRLGYQAPAAGSASGLRPRDLARRLLPKALRKAVAGTLPRERQENLLAQSFRASTDWSRTRAFALPTNHTSMIRVNLCGREPQGTVEPGKEYDGLLEELSGELARLTDPVSGQPVVRETVRTDQAFGCGIPAILPDLFVQWAPCARFLDHVHHPRAELTQLPPEFFRGTEHRPDGFLAACGPAVCGRGDLGALQVLDLAPTFLRLLGLGPGLGMGGQPVAALCGQEKA